MAKQVCSVADCERWCFGHGFCERHYSRWRKHGDPLGGGPDRGALHVYLEELIAQDGDECIEWPGAKCSKGYGRVTLNGKRLLAHRFICERTNGAPSSKNLHAAHSCGNSSCVNWKHIRWATAKENAADKYIHGTRHFGEDNSFAKLTNDDVRSIRANPNRVPQGRLAQQHGVSQSMISKIVLGKVWQHV